MEARGPNQALHFFNQALQIYTRKELIGQKIIIMLTITQVDWNIVNVNVIKVIAQYIFIGILFLVATPTKIICNVNFLLGPPIFLKYWIWPFLKNIWAGLVYIEFFSRDWVLYSKTVLWFFYLVETRSGVYVPTMCVQTTYIWVGCTSLLCVYRLLIYE